MDEITDEMLIAAVRSLVKDKILPTHAGEDTYMHHYDSVKRALEAAINNKQ